MVKRATFQVSSRTKKNHPENGGIGEIKKRQQIQHLQYFTTKLPLQEKQVAKLSWRSSCFGCLPGSKIAQGEALFIVVKVVLVVFPTQQAASKQHDTTLEALHLRIKNYTIMNKKNKNINSNENHGNHCQHVQIGGQAYYDDRKYFLFSPDTPVPQAVESFRKAGVGQQMSDGTFDFVPQPRTKSRSVLIRKLAHGRISKTQDDAVQLTLKFFRTENVVIAQAIMDEAQAAIDALLNYQLTK